MLTTLLALSCAASAWPAAGSLTTITPTQGFARLHPRIRVAIDAGHGSAGNHGARSLTCEDEERFTLRLAEDLAKRLRSTGRFTVVETRHPGEAPSYEARLRRASEGGAALMISLHFDVRGEAWARGSKGDQVCYESDGSIGFAVLWSDEGPLGARRHRIARSLASSLSARGFLAYDGADYPGLYDPDALTPGVFVDRHEPGRRIYMLRAAALPVIILETHHALHAEEWARWQEEETLRALGDAATEALLRDGVQMGL